MKTHILIFLLIASYCSGATYYIDFASGADANNGTSKSTPWKHHPYMQGRTGTYTHAAGDRFIFKGGVTWDHTCFSLSISTGGNAGSLDYYGVDKTWFTGVAWARPIFNGEGINLASGANTSLVALAVSNVTIDNIEITGMYISTPTFGIGSIAGYIGVATNILIQNCYIHNWSVGPNVTTDDARGGIIFTIPNETNVVVDSCTITNIEQAARMNGIAIRQVNTISNCVIHDVSTAIAYAGQIFGNTIYNINTPNSCFDKAFHTNVMYIALWQGSGVIPTTVSCNVYNNVIHDIDAGTQIYCEPCFGGNGGTMNIYNNVVWNNNAGGAGGMVLADPEGGTGPRGIVNVYNNTLVVNSGFAIYANANHSGTNSIATMLVQNNHCVTETTAINIAAVTVSTQDHNLTQSHAAATAQGYTIANSFAPVAGGATIDAGISQILTFTKDLLGIGRPVGGAWDIGAYEFATAVLPSATLTITTP